MHMEPIDASYSQAWDTDDALVDQQTENTRTKSLTVVRCLSQQVRQDALLLSKESIIKLIKPMGIPMNLK